MRHYDSVVDVNQCQRVGIRSCLLILFSFCQHPPQDEVLKYMSEAIISRRGGKGNGGNGSSTPNFVLTSKTFTSNTSWVVPNHNGAISVRIFGGGGGGSYWSGGGGGGGWMNNGDLTLANGSSIPITIGAGGNGGSYGSGSTGGAGGSSSFGIWLSANGGEGGEFSQYGPGNGGDGGSGGGGGWNGYGWEGRRVGGGCGCC